LVKVIISFSGQYLQYLQEWAPPVFEIWFLTLLTAGHELIIASLEQIYHLKWLFNFVDIWSHQWRPYC
jgi:hypothetical protein